MQFSKPSPSLLFLLNGGDFTRHYLIGMLGAASELGHRCFAIELDPVWEQVRSSVRPQGEEIADLIRSQNVAAVIGSSLNGTWEWPVDVDANGRTVSFFERHGVPQILWWTDHPHWANEKIGLRADLQPILQAANNHHFVKSDVAADELREMLGWQHVYGLPVAEIPEMLQPVRGVEPAFDVVAIVGSPPRLDPAIVHFLDRDDPDPREVVHALKPGVVEKLREIWRQYASADMFNVLDHFGQAWVSARCTNRRTASFHLFKQLEAEHGDGTRWLRANPRVYFHAVEALWDLGHWERTFTLMYLARYFRVGVFGMDWSSVGLGGSDRVAYAAQPSNYARGRVAINIAQGNDEEGLSHKPFQIAACGVPMLHNLVQGLSACFAPNEEVMSFDSPREARECVAALLADSRKAEAMAHAARERVGRDHTWKQRLPRMLEVIANPPGAGAKSCLADNVHGRAAQGTSPTSCVPSAAAPTT